MAATTRTFSDMLNQYLPDQIFTTELVKRDYIIKNVEQVTDWKTGTYIVPFEGAAASSVSYGALTASNDVSEDLFVRGQITTAKEIWGTMIFNHRDLMEHDGKIPESTFLRILPDRVENFMKNLKQSVSQTIGSGPHFARGVTDGNASGEMQVDKIDRFQLNQKVTLDDDNSAAADYYVIAIDLNATADYGKVTLSATRGGAAADISAYTAAQNAKFYHPGVLTNGAFISFREALLSAANGGSSTLHGISKLAYPHLQAINIDGSDVTKSNILDKLFDFFVKVAQKARGGKATKLLCSYKHMGSVMKLLEVQKGAFKVTKDPVANQYGWWEIGIASLGNGMYLELVGLQEWDDDIIVAWDPSSVKFATNGMFRKRKSPDGIEYFEVRNTSGYQYLVDVCLFGEMAWHAPGNNGILFGISYS